MRYSHPTLLLLLLSFLAFYVSCRASFANLDVNNWSSFERAIQAGELNGFFSISQTDQMIDFMYKNFPDLLLPVEVIGQSFEGRDINMYCLTKKGGDTTFDQEAETKTIAYLTSMHHSREPLTLTMTLFFMFRALVEYRKRKTEYVSLLDNNIVCAIPLIGVDGYAFMEENFRQTGVLKLIRKNRNPTFSKKCSEDQYGVDLNRNYDYFWGQSNHHGPADECQEIYPGAGPFSEPETEAIRNFVDNNADRIKLAVNMHTFGNLWIAPADDNPGKTARVKNIYKDYFDNAKFAPNNKVGTGLETVGYKVYGDASDWILAKYGILSLNPELGLRLKEDNMFFPPKHLHYRVITKNFASLFYMFDKLTPVVRTKTAYIHYREGISNQLNTVLFNDGYRDLWEPTIKVSLQFTTIDATFTQSIQSIPIKMNEKSLDKNFKSNTITAAANFAEQIVEKDRVGEHYKVIYTVEQSIDLKSWNNLHLTAQLPPQGYSTVHVEIAVLERGKKIYSYWADFMGKKMTTITE